MESHPPPHSSRLIIDNDAIAANFRDLARRVAPATCGAVIKADGYGLGAGPVGSVLIGEATPVKIGKRVSVWQTRIRTEDGAEVALVTQTQLVLWPA